MPRRLALCVALVLGEGDAEGGLEGALLADGERVPTPVRESVGAEVNEALVEGLREAAAERLPLAERLSRAESLTEGVMEVVARGDRENDAVREPDPVADMDLLPEMEREELPDGVLVATTLFEGEDWLDMEGVGLVEKEGVERGVLDVLRVRIEGVAEELRERAGVPDEHTLVLGVRESVICVLIEREARPLLEAPPREPDAVRVGLDSEGLGVPVTDAVFVDVRVTVPEGALVTVPPLALRRLEPVAEAEPDCVKKEREPDAVEDGVFWGAVREGDVRADWLPEPERASEREAEAVGARRLAETLRDAAAVAVFQAEVLAEPDADAVSVPFADALAHWDAIKLAVKGADCELDLLIREDAVSFADELGLAVPDWRDEAFAEPVELPEKDLSAVAAAEGDALTVPVGLPLPLIEARQWEAEEQGEMEEEAHAERDCDGDGEEDAFWLIVAQLAEGEREGVMVCVSDSDAVEVEEGETEEVDSHLSEVSAN